MSPAALYFAVHRPMSTAVVAPAAVSLVTMVVARQLALQLYPVA